MTDEMTLERIDAIIASHGRRESANIGSDEFALILDLARRAIKSGPVVEACIAWANSRMDDEVTMRALLNAIKVYCEGTRTEEPSR